MDTITIFRDFNFKNPSLQFAEGTYLPASVDSFNHPPRVRVMGANGKAVEVGMSAKIPFGLRLIFQYTSPKLKPLVLEKDTPQIKLAGPYSSFKVEVISCVRIYEEKNFQGNSRGLPVGDHPNISLYIGNDTLSSLKVPRGYRVTLYKDGLGSASKVFVNDAVFVGNDFDNVTSSLKIEQIPVVTIFRDKNFGGISQVLTEGSYDLKIGGAIGNDQLSSLKVPPGWQATIYRDGWNSPNKTFTADTPDVGVDFNVTSCIRITKVPLAAPPPLPKAATKILQFNGTQTCTANFNTILIKPSSPSGFTISLWFRTSNPNCSILSLGKSGDALPSCGIFLKGGAIFGRTNTEIVSTTQSLVRIRAAKNFADGLWHKLTYSVRFNRHALIIDEEILAELPNSVNRIRLNIIVPSINTIIIGSINQSPAIPGFQGDISEVAIWSEARFSVGNPQAQLKKRMTLIERGLVAWWDFNKGNGNSIPEQKTSKARMTINGTPKWEMTTFFKELIDPTLKPSAPAVNIAQVREVAQSLADSAKPLSRGNENLSPQVLAAPPVSLQTLPQFNIKDQATVATANNNLTLTDSMLGRLASVANLFLKNALAITNPAIALVKITPGTSAEDGEPLAIGNLSDMMATAQGTALKISGDVSIFSGLSATLKYAEFSQLDGVPYAVLKFVFNNPIGLSSIWTSNTLLDSISLSSPSIVLSSSGDITDAVEDTGLVEGLNFFGTINLASSGNKGFQFIGGFLGLEQINLHGSMDVSETPPSYELEAIIPIQKSIISGSNFSVILRKITFGVSIEGEPVEIAMSLITEMVVKLSNTDLVLTGGIKLEAESVTGMFTMQAVNQPSNTSPGQNVVSQGEWKDPFGIPGLTIRELAVQAGLTFEAPFIDNFGMHGNLMIGTEADGISGSASVLFDVNDPDEFVMACTTDRLSIGQIMSCMLQPKLVFGSITGPIQNFVALQLEDVNIHIVPTATSIGAIEFEQGVIIKGRLSAWGWKSSMKIKIDQANGIEVEGGMDSINIQNVLIVTGSGADVSPKLSLKLLRTSPPDLFITAKAILLGLSQETKITAGDSGFKFLFKEAIPGVLTTNLSCDLDDGGNLIADGTIIFRVNANISTALGNIALVDVAVNAATTIKAGPKWGGVAISISGNFSLWGQTVTIPTISFSVTDNTFVDFLSLFNRVIKQVTDAATDVFKNQVFKTLQDCADAVAGGVIMCYTEMAAIGNQVYNATVQQVSAAYITVGKTAQDAANGMQSIYQNATSQEVAGALKGAGYAARDAAVAVIRAYSLAADQATAAMLKNAGYAAEQVGAALTSAFTITNTQAVTALKGAGYALNETVNFVSNLGPTQAAVVLQGAGYATDQIAGCFQGMGGAFSATGNTLQQGLNSGLNTLKDILHL